MARYVRGERLPLIILTITVAIAMITGGALSYGAYKRFRQSSIKRSSAFRLQEQRERIVHLDTVLSMSARLAAATNEPRWYERYQTFHPILENTLGVVEKDTKGMAPSANVARIREARAWLCDAESKALDWAKQGRNAEAMALLIGADYEEKQQAVARNARRLVATERSYVRLLELAGTLERRAEDVAMDVRMAVSTGDQRWRAKHRESAAELVVAQRAAVAALNQPRNAPLVRQLVSLRSELQRVENQALELAAPGKTERAARILRDASYDARQEDYRRRIGRLSERLRSAAEGERQNERAEALTDIAGIASVLLAMLIGWIYALRTIERYAAERESAELALEQARRDGERRLREVTASLRAENDQLRQVDERKTTFLSHVAHELRTPLTAVVSAAKILIRHHEKKPEVVPRFGSTIVVEGERLSRLINDVLDLVKIEAGRMEWNDERVDPWGIVQQATALVEPLCQEKELDLSVQFPSLVPPIWGDSDRLVQVLTNLLNNAIKFTNEGDSICVTAETEDDQCVFSVRDSGVGIPKEDLDKVFERFHQVAGQPTDQPKNSSTGLGLTICKEIVEHHGGRIWVDSTLGEGTAFHFSVPTETGNQLAVSDEDDLATLHAG